MKKTRLILDLYPYVYHVGIQKRLHASMSRKGWTICPRIDSREINVVDPSTQELQWDGKDVKECRKPLYYCSNPELKKQIIQHSRLTEHEQETLTIRILDHWDPLQPKERKKTRRFIATYHILENLNPKGYTIRVDFINLIQVKKLLSPKFVLTGYSPSVVNYQEPFPFNSEVEVVHQTINMEESALMDDEKSLKGNIWIRLRIRFYQSKPQTQNRMLVLKQKTCPWWGGLFADQWMEIPFLVNPKLSWQQLQSNIETVVVQKIQRDCRPSELTDWIREFCYHWGLFDSLENVSYEEPLLFDPLQKVGTLVFGNTLIVTCRLFETRQQEYLNFIQYSSLLISIVYSYLFGLLRYLRSETFTSWVEKPISTDFTVDLD